MEAVLDYAKVRGWRSGENPARWKGHLDHILPARSKVARVRHHAALPWVEVPAFLVDLRSREGIVARALEFAIMTASRTSETLGMVWSEVDLETALWFIPEGRMKAGREHRVPLSAAAVGLLRAMMTLAPSLEPGQPIFWGQASSAAQQHGLAGNPTPDGPARCNRARVPLFVPRLGRRDDQFSTRHR